MRSTTRSLLALLTLGMSLTFGLPSAASADYQVTFQTDATPGATLDGATSQTVVHGGDCTSITAQAPTSRHPTQLATGVCIRSDSAGTFEAVAHRLL